jgi:copper homeostasis protein
MTPPPSVLVEACVDSVLSARRAVEGGAGRLELCANLIEGGTTPSSGLMRVVRRAVSIPIHVLIRPRGGDFLYGPDDLDIMLQDIAEAKRIGLAGVVIGVLQPDGTIDRDLTRRLGDEARPLAVTFHRAFDLTRDPFEALEALFALGIERVLTSGQGACATEGIPVIRQLVERSAGRVAVLAGGGVNEGNAAQIVRETGVREVHLRGSGTESSAMTFRRQGVRMGKSYQPDEYVRTETEASRIQAVVTALSRDA